MSASYGPHGGEKKRISQETFDAAVEENIEEFEMEREEALADAVTQVRFLPLFIPLGCMA